MQKALVILSLLVLSISVAWTQPNARVQIIHNAADPAAASVDIYVNGDLFLDDFGFQTATPFVDVPANTELSIAVAPGNSASVDDALATFPVTLDADETYTVIANGVLDPAAFADNPDGKSTGFQLIVKTGAKEMADNSNEVEFFVLHGATDAPAVDVKARDVATLVDGAAYGDMTDYLAVPPQMYLLDVYAAGTETVVATFKADLSALAGGAATVFASGFLSPDDDQDGAAFGILAALPDGTVLPLEAVTTARVQVIHNAADPAANTVDLFLNGDKLVDNFAFRTATPFIDAPANTELSVAVAPSNSASVDDAIATFPATLMAGGTYVIIANGVLDPAAFADNPDGKDTGFTLLVKDMAKEMADNDDEVEFFVLHGATDAPAVDVKARDVATLVDGAAYGDMTDYIAVPPQMYLLDVYAAGTETLVATFDANLSGLAGGAAAVFASGFLSPDDDQNGAAFGIFAALPDGQVVEFPPFDLGEKAPNALVYVTGSETYKKGKFTRGWENAVDGDMTGFDGTTWARGDGDQMGPAWAIFRYADFGLYKFNYLAFLTDNGPEDNANPYDYQTLILDVWVSTTGMDDDDFTKVIEIKRKGDGKFLEWRQLGEYVTAKYVKLRLLSPSYYPASWRQIVEFQTQTEKKMGAMPAADQNQIAALPKGTELVGNYPNPFNPETVIRYTLDRDAQVSLQIFDTLGRVVATLVDGRQNAGTYNITWRPANLPSGLYFYRMTAGEVNSVKRMMFIK
jgi:hypothetical protein